MGKYRTRVNNAKSANSVCNGGKSVNVVSCSSAPKQQFPSVPDGNCTGKFERNAINSSQSRSRSTSTSTPTQKRRRQARVVLLYVIASLVLGCAATENGQGLPSGFPTPTPESDNPRVENGGVVQIEHNPFLEEEHQHPNCTRPSANDFPPDLFSMEARRRGAIVLHLLVSLYLFYAILILCDEYFVPAVESICRELRIPSDVAGATFMAISTSAPELFTNVIATFVTNGDTGVGTIVGSAVFNILAVGACCGILAGYKLATSTDKVGVRLDWWSLTRDSLFYLISVGTLIGVLYDRKVYWSEALLMLCLYTFYVLVLCFDSRIKSVVIHYLCKIGSWLYNKNDESEGRLSVIVGKILDINERTPLLVTIRVTEDKRGSSSSPSNNDKNHVKICSGHDDFIMNSEYDDIPGESLDQVLIDNALARSGSFSQPVDECSGCCSKWPSQPDASWEWKTWLEWAISWPIRFFFWISVPNCRVYSLRKWYWATLGLCIVWIGVITYVISWMVTIIGDTLSIPDSVTGLTFLAAGTSIPEVISSLIVARQGLGSMGFSNTIGSNTFDVLVCLGLPWLIKSALVSSTSSAVGVDYVEIHSGGLEYSAVILISALLVLYFAIAFNGFVLDRKIGWICVIMYLIFISFACMVEMNVFFPVNLPPC